jgi:hypothetical protein
VTAGSFADERAVAQTRFAAATLALLRDNPRHVAGLVVLQAGTASRRVP